MKKGRITVFLTAILAGFFLFAGTAHSSGEDLEIGRMRVAVWPEHDSSGVLFIYDGRFKNNDAFPNETSFYLPRGAVISDACSLSPKGTHFCQLYKIKNIDASTDEVSLKLPYPNFYLSFHTDPFQSGSDKRTLRQVIRANHRVDRLEVDVESPLRAVDFKITSPEGFEASEKKGFTHYEKVFENVDKGALVTVDLEYVKKDNRPSMDIKYSPMSGGGASGASYREQGGFLTYVYIAVAAGAALLVALLFLVVRSKGGKG